MNMLFQNKKHQKFCELAEKRTNKALDAIRLIGNLSNHQLYEWEDRDIQKIIKALRSALNDVDARFKKTVSQRGGEFRL